MQGEKVKKVVSPEPLLNDPKSLKEREMQLPHFFKVMDEYESFIDLYFRDQVLALLRGDVQFLNGPRNLTRDEFYRVSKHHKLPARVSDLRDDGHKIDGPMVESPSGRSRIKDYRLIYDAERRIKYSWKVRENCEECGTVTGPDLGGGWCDVCGDQVTYCDDCLIRGRKTMPDGLPDYELCEDHIQ